MAVFPIKLDLVNCTYNNSSKEYVNNNDTWAIFAAKAVDGCEFKENDGENFYISRKFSGSTRKTPFNVTKVSSSNDQKVINGEIDGITSDGKYICRRVTVSSANTGEMTCYINASLGTPTPTNLLRYDTSGLTGDVTITDKQGTDAHHFDITVTGNGDGTFSNLVATYQDWDGNYIKNEPFNVSGNVGTITVYCNKGDEIAITGEFVSGGEPEPPTPPTPTNLLRYDTTGFTGDVTITDKQGTDAHHFDITVTGNGDGTFSNLVATYQDWDGNYIKNEPFNVSGNVATLTVYCGKNEEITITGSFISGVRELQITNNISNTTAKSVASETNYTVTVTGNAKGMFNGKPTITYGGETYNMTVTNQTATAIVPIATESVVINGEYLLGKYIEVQYGLTNCEIVGDKPVKVKTGQSYTFNFKANANAELTEIKSNFKDDDGNPVVVNGTISEDKQTGSVTFELTPNAVDLNIVANANVVTPPTIKNYGAINVYIVTLDNLDEFAKKRFFVQTSETETGTSYSEVNLGAYVNRIKRIFAHVPVGGDDVLKCGNYNTGIKVKYPDSDVMLLDFGNVELTGANGNNEDFNAQVQMFIPCRGVVSIDSKYIGKTVNLSIKVNVITGDAVALLTCDGVTFQIESFSLSRDVLYRLGTDLNVVGGEQWNEQILYGLEPYVLITENLTVDVPVNNTQENVTINAVTGFAQFENVNLDAANLLVGEYDEIISQLETGVYL
jgi:hypothetical protein